jgi:hypothetical protein
MAKIFEKLIFGGLHEKHAVQRGIWATEAQPVNAVVLCCVIHREHTGTSILYEQKTKFQYSYVKACGTTL